MTDDPKSRAIAVAEQLRARAAAKPLTDAQRKLLDFSAKIFDEPATVKDAAYMPRELVQVTVPHKNPGNIPVWRRTNGNLTVGIQPGADLDTGESYGYPYGIIPRLILFWITTEATRKNSRHLELGNSLAGFMAELGLDPNRGGKRSDARRLREQTQRLINARISFQSTVDHGDRKEKNRLNMDVAPKSSFWWSVKDPNQPTLWGSWIELSQDFFDALTAFPVPADMARSNETLRFDT